NPLRRPGGHRQRRRRETRPEGGCTCAGRRSAVGPGGPGQIRLRGLASLCDLPIQLGLGCRTDAAGLRGCDWTTMITAAVLSSPFACPSCHEALEMGAAELRCETCGRGYQVFDGVPSFCETESFYEDYLEEHCPFVASPPSWKATLLRVLPYWSW